MSKFIIKDDFWDIFPEAEIAVLLAKGLDNSEEGNAGKRSEINEKLKEANKTALSHIPKEILRENKVVSVWREAFQKFKTRKGARASIEAMLKRISKGNEIGPINPLVDIYNTVSLNYAIPCGGEDLDSLKGDMVLTVADGGEPFFPLGADEEDNALLGEVIYKDDVGAVCRCWNWREGERTMLTDTTENAFLIIESVDPSRHDEYVAAAKDLKTAVSKYLDCPIETHFLDINNKEISL